MASGFGKLAGLVLLVACAGLSPTDEAGAVAVPCISGIGGYGSEAIDLVHDGCVASKGDPFGVYLSNDKEEAVENAIRVATGVAVDISLFGKSEDGADTSLIDITPIQTEGDGGILTGEWRIRDESIFVQYITIKAATSYIVYEIADGGANAGTFTTAALRNPGGQQPAVSHISFWLGRKPTEVPEPAPLALLGCGLAGLGILGLRKRA